MNAILDRHWKRLLLNWLLIVSAVRLPCCRGNMHQRHAMLLNCHPHMQPSAKCVALHDNDNKATLRSLLFISQRRLKRKWKVKNEEFGERIKQRHEEGERAQGEGGGGQGPEINIWCIIMVQLPGLLGDHIRMREGGTKNMWQTRWKNNFKAAPSCGAKKCWSTWK